MFTSILFFNYMIEAATGVAFLMSSLYGAGHANATTIDKTIAPQALEATTTTSSSYDTKEMEAYLRNEYADTPILVDVARCESTFRQFDSKGMVVRGKVNSLDVGLMQINERYHADTAMRLGYDIYSVEGNVSFAKYLYSKYGTSPWSSSAKCWKASAPIAER